ncbi:isochorismatase family protein [Rhodococcus sp. IEGM 1381]|uniref:cysteine hydrolase family protein n=1 Tax=Rhodococcus sp. IEGM 1381 TaxID=3047085 RepID=UPI0024B870A2|nr:isochorismatase family protein [Rhodococcus sp. IEGM 1381]MDI9897403.1 isochorismatase family protein [Rhodococcus sp. IEGM 1381]
MTRQTDAPRWWTTMVTDADPDAYSKGIWSVKNTLGTRPALLVIDVVRAFTGEEGQSMEEATADFPTSCGPNAWESMDPLKRVIDLAEGQGWPIVYTTALTGMASIYGGTVKGDGSSGASAMDKPESQDIPDAITPPESAVVFAKPKASAFFDTALMSYLVRQGVDSVIVTGGTTSGCVRATVIDSHSHGYPTFVIEDAVFDRSRLSHGVNLFEMNAKYADAITADQLADIALQR